MANVTTVQTIQDGERNLIIAIAGVLDTSNVAKTQLVDVSALVPATARLKLKEAKWSAQQGLSINLYWDATTDVPFLCMSGSDHQCYAAEGHIPNNAGTGVTGDVDYETSGWASGILTYSAVLWFIKGTPL